MRKSVEVRKQLQSKIEAQRTIAENGSGENGALNSDEQTRFDEAQTEINALEEELARSIQAEKNARRAAELNAIPVAGGVEDPQKEQKKVESRFSLHKAIRQVSSGQPLDGAEAEMHQEAQSRAREAGQHISGFGVLAPTKRADGATVTQDSGNNGANLVAEDLGSPIEFLRPTPVLESLGARMITGLTGDVAYPTNEGGITATWEGEVDTVAATKNAYGKKTMKPNRLAVNALLSLQNIMQSSPDLEAMTINDINAVVANQFDQKAINGTGAGNQPTGILNAAGIGSVVAGDPDGGAPTWDHIVGLESSIFVNNYNGARLAYLINAATKGKLKKTKHQAGDLGYLMDGQNQINGYEVGISNLVPGDLTKGSGTALQAGIFGDFSQLLMGQWGFYDFTVDNISRKADGYVGLIVNTFVDVLVRQEKAFAAVKDWDIS